METKSTTYNSRTAALGGHKHEIKSLIILTSDNANAGDFIKEALVEAWDTEIIGILENPQELINAFNSFYHEGKYLILDKLFERGLSYDLGFMVLSMHDFKPIFLVEFTSIKFEAVITAENEMNYSLQ